MFIFGDIWRFQLVLDFDGISTWSKHSFSKIASDLIIPRNVNEIGKLNIYSCFIERKTFL